MQRIGFVRRRDQLCTDNDWRMLCIHNSVLLIVLDCGEMIKHLMLNKESTEGKGHWHCTWRQIDIDFTRSWVETFTQTSYLSLVSNQRGCHFLFEPLQ